MNRRRPSKSLSGATLDAAQFAQAIEPSGLVPARLEEMANQVADQLADRAAEELLSEGESANTVAAYRAAMRYWAAWFAERFGMQIALPVSAAAVRTFITDHAQRRASGSNGAVSSLVSELPPEIDARLVAAGFKGRSGPFKLSTLQHRVSVLSKAHQLANAVNPCADAGVRLLLARTRSAYAKRGQRATKQTALTRELLQQLLDTCDDSLRGIRDRALLSFAWATGGRRRSEVEGAAFENLTRIEGKKGFDGYFYHLTHSKTNQEGIDRPEDHKPLVGSAAQAMTAWLTASRITEGALFRRVLRGNHLGPPLSAAGVRRIVQERCALAGLEGKFSAHSLRSGFVTEAGRQDMPIGETMAMTGHHTMATFLGYYQAEASLKSKVASMLDGEPSEDAHLER